MSFLNMNKRTHVQERVDTRTNAERARDHYTKMELDLQTRISSLTDTIKRATLDLEESNGILASVHAAQRVLETYQGKLLDHFEEQVLLAADELRIDQTDPTMPMGENGNSRVD